MNKIQKAKAWTKNHKDEILGWSLVGGLAALYVTAIAVSVKDQQAAVNEASDEIPDYRLKVLTDAAGDEYVMIRRVA